MPIDPWADIRADALAEQEQAPKHVKPSRSEVAAYESMAEVVPGVGSARPVMIQQGGDIPMLYPDKKDKKELPMVSGAKALDLAALIIRTYCRVKPEEVIVAALWAAHTWFNDGKPRPRMQFRATPRMLAIGEPGSGKTRYGTVTRAMSHDPSAIMNTFTAPLLREYLAKGQSVFLDEFHRKMGRGRQNAETQAIITGGYTPEAGGGTAFGGINEQNIFGPIFMMARPALIDNTGEELSDVLQRSFIVWTEESFEDIPDLDEDFDALADVCGGWLKRWGAQERIPPTEDIKKPIIKPLYQINPELKGRKKEIAMPLLAVADRADRDMNGQRDLRWPLLARQAVDQMLLGQSQDPAQEEAKAEKILAGMGLSLAGE
jgi:hypothetical protein